MIFSLAAQESHSQHRPIYIDDSLFSYSSQACFFFFGWALLEIFLHVCLWGTYRRGSSLGWSARSWWRIGLRDCRGRGGFAGIFLLLDQCDILEFNGELRFRDWRRAGLSRVPSPFLLVWNHSYSYLMNQVQIVSFRWILIKECFDSNLFGLHLCSCY